MRANRPFGSYRGGVRCKGDAHTDGTLQKISADPILCPSVVLLGNSKKVCYTDRTIMLDLKPVILKKEDDKHDAYYTLRWTVLTKADKYRITTAVPAIAGMYELYYMDTRKKLNLLAITHAWYGGLRSNLRQAVDPYHTHDLALRAILEDAPLYYRYSCSDSFGDLLDTVWFLHTVYFPHDVRVTHSQRYRKIFLEEQAPDKIYWLDD